MDSYDIVIIGAGPGGEAAAHEARLLGAAVAIADARWFGGSCPFIGCIPSKSLLNAAARHGASPASYSWKRASDRRDYMVNRAPDAPEPDDSSHVSELEQAGAAVYRGLARITGRGRVEIRHDDAVHEVGARWIVVAVGSVSKDLPIEGWKDLPAEARWTNEQATLARELPRSLVVLGGGPTGCEMAQVYARFGVQTTIVQSGERILPTDHPRNAEAVAFGLRESGVTIRTGVRATAIRPGAGPDGAHAVDLSDGTSVAGHALLAAAGRTIPLEGLGLEHYGLDASTRGGVPHDGRVRVAEGLLMIGDSGGPELHTHQAHYQGERAARMALGQPVELDYRALPRATYTDPEAASVGYSLDQAKEAGIDALELVADFTKTSKGYSVEAKTGHVTVVFDRATRTMVGAAMACPDASAAIHECVLAIRAGVPIEILAETIHAFPSTSRILNGLFADAARQLRD